MAGLFRFGRPSMPWNEVSVMDQRREFVRLALQEGANRRELFRRFGISPDVGYKWLARWEGGDCDLGDRSHRPQQSGAIGIGTGSQGCGASRCPSGLGCTQDCGLVERDGEKAPAVSTVH